MRRILLVSASLFALSACDLAPDFALPKFDMPSNFKEQAKGTEAEVVAPTDGKWQQFDEKAKLDETAWWKIFNDPTLDALEAHAMAENPTIDAAIQRVNAARAIANQARADLYPEVDVQAGPTRQKNAIASARANAPGATIANTKPYTLYTANATITYEVDLFGRTRNSILFAAMNAEAEEQNLRTSRIALQAELAQTYFTLASTRSELKTLDQTIGLQRNSLNLTVKKRDIGEVDDLAVSSEETALASNEAVRAQLVQQMAAAEHALATLVGTFPSNFDVKTVELNSTPPTVPAGLPSSLLERRPDIQAAAKLIAAANANIGVARTGYFPSLGLTLEGGFTSDELGSLFAWSNRSWLVGPLLSMPIFQGGRATAFIAQRDAEYQESVANYRAAVLQAFREVEDNLSGLRNLSDAYTASNRGLKASKRAYDIASARYKYGDISYLDYISAQQSYFNAQRNEVEVRGSRYITTIDLIRALGGGWNAPQATPPVADAAAKPIVPLTAKPDAIPTVTIKPASPALAPLSEQKTDSWSPLSVFDDIF